MKYMKLINRKRIELKDLKYKATKYVHDFQPFETIKYFSGSIYTGKINTDEAEMDQTNQLENMIKLNNKSIPRQKKIRMKK